MEGRDYKTIDKGGCNQMSNIIDVLQAKDEIHELIARYCHTLDFGFYEEWVDCFTEDGAFDSPIFGRHPGKVALRKLTESYKIWVAMRNIATAL
jgi:hypothetical protein